MISVEEIKVIRQQYPNLELSLNEAKLQILKGPLLVYCTFDDFTVNEVFQIEIEIPKRYPFEIPNVREIENKIDHNYAHVNKNGFFCLAVDGEIIRHFNGNINIVDLIVKFIIPFFFSYKYYQRFEKYPFGDRSHGEVGILESYAEYFGIDDLEIVYNFLKHAATQPYVGRAACPCRSGKRVNQCHKELLQEINYNEYIKKSLTKDFCRIPKKRKRQ